MMGVNLPPKFRCHIKSNLEDTLAIVFILTCVVYMVWQIGKAVF